MLLLIGVQNQLSIPFCLDLMCNKTLKTINSTPTHMNSEAVSRGVQGGGATSLIDHQGGAGHTPVIFDIFDSGFYITYTNYTS